MKKYLLLLLLLFPFVVSAESYTIKTKVDVEGKELEQGEFIFNLKDQQGNIIQTKTNDLEGNVIFDNIDYTEDDLGNKTEIISHEGIERNGYLRSNTVNNANILIYTIEQIPNKYKGYTFDDKTTYVKVILYKDTDGLKSTVRYFKYPDEEELLAKTPDYEYKPFHTDVTGDVIYETDLENQTVRIFMGNKNDYSNQYQNNYTVLKGTKYYYTFDGYNNYYIAASTYSGRYITDDGEIKQSKGPYYIKKVIIDGPVKLADGHNLFRDLHSLEEIEGIENLDTSLMTDMEFMFSDTYSLKVIDVTHMDVSNVKSMAHMFFLSISYNYDTGEVSLPDRVVEEGITQPKIEEIKIPTDWPIYNILTDESTTHTVYGMFWGQYTLKNVNLKWFKIPEGTPISSEMTSNYMEMFKYTNFEVMNLSNFGAHINRHGLGMFITDASPYYVDITGITSDMCAYGSNDFLIHTDRLRIIKTNEDFHPYMGLFHDKYSSNYFGYLYYYNIDKNEVSNAIKLANYNGNDGTCEQIPGGTWINIDDDEAVYHNLYVKPNGLVKGIEEIVENPKTGIFRYTFRCLILLAIVFYIYTKVYKKTLFRRY